MFLLTENDDILTTENGTQLATLDYPVCDWPTLEEVKAELGVTVPDDDAIIQRMINATSRSIEGYCDRKIPFQYATEAFFITPCDLAIGATTKLDLTRFPVKQVDRCYRLSNDQDITFQIDGQGALCGQFNIDDTVMVNYYGGLACPIPDDIIDVFYQIVTSRYAAKDAVASSGQMKSESIPGVMKIEYYQDADGTSTSSFAPSNYDYILDFYKTYYV